MLAKNVNDTACLLNERGACEFFASKLAPTEGQGVPPPTFCSVVYQSHVCNPTDLISRHFLWRKKVPA
ncbi:hypothetical protein EUX53_23960 [Pseudomonas orientalis]|nr:hypothetical protein EUX53_23960 [Pseudomonas orientalis]